MKTSFKRAAYAALVAAGTVAFAACSSSAPQEPIATSAPANATATPAPEQTQGESDAEFVQSAAQTEAGRYALGAIGVQRANAAPLKSLAANMSSDAAASSRWLTAYASKHGIHVDNHPKVRTMYQYSQMTGLTGSAFDRAYAQAVNTDASLSLDAFQTAAHVAADPRLREFAKRAAAQLEANSKQARAF
ncbi:MAG TPA: DUF4142 domain-containing protein [Candidatus Tumulicola sp.]|nr:DUF4142 domain-containing protein [Candidatus Tumulicola sp.]